MKLSFVVDVEVKRTLTAEGKSKKIPRAGISQVIQGLLVNKEVGELPFEGGSYDVINWQVMPVTLGAGRKGAS